jgi:hypothetical protein
MGRLYGALVFAFFLVVTAANAGELSIRKFPLPGHGALVMPVPDSWLDHLAQPADGLPPTLRLIANSVPKFEILITPAWSMAGKRQPLDAADIRKEVERAAKILQSHSVEKKLEIKAMKGTGGVGYYFSATYRASKPGEYRHLTQGMLPVGELTITFTILTNDGDDGTTSTALLLLQDATQTQADAR